MVYLYEMGPNRVKGLIGSIGVASAMVGCMMGVLAVVIMEAIFSPGERVSCIATSLCLVLVVEATYSPYEPQQWLLQQQLLLLL
jgi:hypothetical protein